MKRIVILGSTGSIGVNTLDVIDSLRGRFEVVGLSARSNIGLLAAQAARFSPRILAVMDRNLEKRLRALVASRKTTIVSGEEGLLEIVARNDVDMVVFAISGTSCLGPLVKAIECGKGIALANKEALVSAGEIIMRRASSRGARVIPIDSEHSAIFQCLEGGARKFLKRIYLTSSGGPLLNVDKKRFQGVSREFVLRHPRWKMGKKITVDSATLMNKGLEIIEARWLFDIGESNIEVLIHPEAVVHSLVELLDGAVLAQLAATDMRLPIQFALTYPERLASIVRPLDLVRTGRLTFKKPDLGRFPCLALARRALKDGGTYPAVLTAADEEVVAHFLSGEIPFSRIPRILEKVLERHRGTTKVLTLSDVRGADEWARVEARRLCYR
jgi:1-deoxy-D-xylulose-5-phosphate reductoisomerase